MMLDVALDPPMALPLPGLTAFFGPCFTKRAFLAAGTQPALRSVSGAKHQG